MEWFVKIVGLSLFLVTSCEAKITQEDLIEKLDHAHSFLESFLSGTADNMFSDRNLFAKVNKDENNGDQASEQDNDKETFEKAVKPEVSNSEDNHEEYNSMEAEDPANSDSGFNYFKVLKENFHNNQKAEPKDSDQDSTTDETGSSNVKSLDKKETKESENINARDDTSLDGKNTPNVDDKDALTAANKDHLAIDNKAVSNVDDKDHSTAYNEDDSTVDNTDALTLDDNNASTNDDLIHTTIDAANIDKTDTSKIDENRHIGNRTHASQLKENINLTANSQETVSVDKAVSNSELGENSGSDDKKEVTDYGPIDRSIKDDPYFSDVFIDAQDTYGPPPLRDQDYFSTQFEMSPSYDLRSAYFLRTQPVHEGAGEGTSKQLVYQENRVDRKDKTIFGGVIGGLAGVFGFLAGKKLILAFVLLGTLIAMGITGTSPEELMQNVMQTFTDFMGLNFLYDFNADGTIGFEDGQTSNVQSSVVVMKDFDSSNVTVDSSVDGPLNLIVVSLANMAVGMTKPFFSFVSEITKMWQSFSEGFLSVTGPNFPTEAERDERMMEPIDIEDLKAEFDEIEALAISVDELLTGGGTGPTALERENNREESKPSQTFSDDTMNIDNNNESTAETLNDIPKTGVFSHANNKPGPVDGQIGAVKTVVSEPVGNDAVPRQTGAGKQAATMAYYGQVSAGDGGGKFESNDVRAHRIAAGGVPSNRGGGEEEDQVGAPTFPGLFSLDQEAAVIKVFTNFSQGGEDEVGDEEVGDEEVGEDENEEPSKDSTKKKIGLRIIGPP